MFSSAPELIALEYYRLQTSRARLLMTYIRTLHKELQVKAISDNAYTFIGLSFKFVELF